jgi:hypothetical protein
VKRKLLTLSQQKISTREERVRVGWMTNAAHGHQTIRIMEFFQILAIKLAFCGNSFFQTQCVLLRFEIEIEKKSAEVSKD